MCVAVPTDDGRNSNVFNGARTTKSTRTIFFSPRTLRQSLSCVLIPFPCVLPGSRVEFCQWCALVRCSPFCLTFLFVPFAPRHHRTSHHGISTHLLHFGVTGFLLSPTHSPSNQAAFSSWFALEIAKSSLKTYTKHFQIYPLRVFAL